MRVLTWNLWWRFGDWRRRREAIRSVLVEQAPDLCGLQEVWATEDENLAGWLADELGMHWAYGPTAHPQRWQQRIGDDSVQFGTAVLSRWPLSAVKVDELPADQGRSVLGATVEAPYARIPFFSAHLSSSAYSTAVRRAQVERIRDLVAARSADSHPPILTGDFNAEPDSDEMRALGGDLTPPTTAPELILMDSWRFAPSGEAGHTWDRRNPHVAEAPEPSMRIDYIRVGLNYRLRVGRVRSVGLAGTEPVDGVWPSDHFAVVADLADG
jgi:endonuclease/exonuclease/phosphatase family metal-dependent hydrolase